MQLEIFFHPSSRSLFRWSHFDLMRMSLVHTGLRRSVAEQLRAHMRCRSLRPRLSKHRNQKNHQSSENLQFHKNPSAVLPIRRAEP